MAKEEDNKKITSIKAASWIIGGAGAVGTGLQNFLAFFSFLSELGKLSTQAIQGIAIALGGGMGGLVNLWMNIDLLKDFFKRLTGEKLQPKLSGWKKFRYYAVSLVFITTGILFGMTAFAFGGVGVLASIGVAAGVLVAVIMMIQELETWLASFDEENQQTSLKEIFTKWWNNLSPARATALVISVGNVLALSLLFALGVTSFLTMLGVPLFPAIVASIVVSFTAGAFTEFYFYNSFLAEFCEKIAEQWKLFKALSFYKKILGILAVTINAAVNGILCYAGIALFNTLLASAVMSPVPLAVIITISAFAGMASFILGAKFWIKALTPETKKTDKEDETAFSKEVEGISISVSDAKPSVVLQVSTPTVKPASTCWGSFFAANTVEKVPAAASDEEQAPFLQPGSSAS